MSPLHVRRYRAERLLRDRFEELRGRVLAGVRGRLQAGGMSLDQGDLEACYAQAWQGLYAATLEGQEIANPAGWLVLATFRRAIDELRARGRTHRHRVLWPQAAGGHEIDAGSELETLAAAEPDLAGQLDDRMRLRQLFEGLSARLDGREREAATLCYLQGLSRAEAATRMGVSEARMHKLMEGRGPGRPGVAAKVGALVQSIREGEWCQEQGSLMRALAYGMLDPDGARYQLALIHHAQCPACRAYVVSLRGLAAVLPPVFLPWGISAAVLLRAGEGAHAGGLAAPGGGVGVGGGGLQAGRAIGAVSASGAAGAGAGGAAGGGWLIGAGPLTAKLAAGCLLALTVGAGCVALDNAQHTSGAHHARHLAAGAHRHRVAIAPAPDAGQLDALPAGARAAAASGSSAGGATVPLTPAKQASREFGPEQAPAPDAGGSAVAAAAAAAAAAARRPPAARSASLAPASAPSSAIGAPASDGAGQSTAGSSSGDSTAAEREFSPG